MWRQDKRHIIRSARAASKVESELSRLRWALLLAAPFALLIAVVGGLLLASRVLRPLRRMADDAQSITANRLNARLEVPNPDDELGALATAFNQAFSRLEESFEQMRRFTADASHELRSPLTAIRTMGEVALRSEVHQTTYREVIASILEETDSLRQLIDNLLMLSRADARQVVTERLNVDVARLVREVVDHLHVLADEKHQELEMSGPAEAPTYLDGRLLRAAVINLVDNAIKYSPEHSTIRVTVAVGLSTVQIDVEDEGPGIPREHEEKIFERFYRIDPSRTRRQAGTGLGLSIARWAIEVQGGTLNVVGPRAKGACFRLEIPMRHSSH